MQLTYTDPFGSGPGPRGLALAAVAAFLLACGEGQEPNPPPGNGPTTDVASVEIVPGGRAVLAGSRLALGTMVLDTLGRELFGQSVTWSVSGSALGAITPDGTLSFLQPGALGVDATVDGVTGHTTMQVVEVDWAALSAGRGHSCGLTTQEVAWCWGYSGRGQVGYGGSENQLAPILAATSLRFSAIENGGGTTCGLTAQGAAHCWGQENGIGYVDGSVADALVPAAVGGGLAFTEITVGGSHACGLTSSGAAYCWGYGILGQLGNGGAASSRVPVPVAGDHVFQELSAGWDHTCGLTTEGAAWCWGSNGRGQLGTELADEGCDSNSFPEPPCQTGPVPVSSAEPFVTISAGFIHTCAVSTAGAAYCWGANEGGELGIGSSGIPERTPVAVAGGHTFGAISAGYWVSSGSSGFTCALDGAGAAFCWGENREGRLGTGNAADQAAPTPVASAMTFTSISAGADHACALSADGVGHCWGGNFLGELGTGAGTGSSVVPVRVPGQAE